MDLSQFDSVKGCAQLWADDMVHEVRIRLDREEDFDRLADVLSRKKEEIENDIPNSDKHPDKAEELEERMVILDETILQIEHQTEN